MAGGLEALAAHEHQVAAEVQDALDRRIEELLRESPEQAQRRTAGLLERQVPNFARVWVEGQGVLARRVHELAVKAGLDVVGHATDCEGLLHQIRRFERRHRLGWDSGADLPADFLLLSLDPTQRYQIELPSWQDELTPSMVGFAPLAWRYSAQNPGHLYLTQPEDRLRRADAYLRAFQQLRDIGSREQFVSRLERGLGRDDVRDLRPNAAPELLDPASYPTPIPHQVPFEHDRRAQLRHTQWVFDFCRPADTWAEVVLRRREPTPWTRIRFHPEPQDTDPGSQEQVRAGWLWPKAWISASREAANQADGRAFPGTLDDYARDYADALGLTDLRKISDAKPQAWDDLSRRPEQECSLLRIQGFAWEALCRQSVDALAKLLIAHPNMELRWETPHALEVMAAWSAFPELRARDWSLEALDDPNRAAVILRRSGR